ncbi:MAG: zf-TFIIB domain-containing protein [Sedimentisphaerales bacterium]|nr:zf-TFIIB domain-containing protein [Sedimentisphaerales bacterium]
MDCPVCKTAMITFELNDVEVDQCLECYGIWLDAGELEMLLPDSGQAKKVLSSFKQMADCEETPRKCPICLKKMHKVNVGSGESTVLIDSCAKGDGLWFDKGELQDIFKFGSFDGDGKVQDLLADIFKNEQKQ